MLNDVIELVESKKRIASIELCSLADEETYTGHPIMYTLVNRITTLCSSSFSLSFALLSFSLISFFLTLFCFVCYILLCFTSVHFLSKIEFPSSLSSFFYI